ncbi:MAG: hypothetical protein H6718_11610 [Polyangiaceae bacterium]|nr:hypothetical protein [Polyangiaceae bacterium]
MSFRGESGFRRIQWRGRMRHMYPRGCAFSIGALALMWCVGCSTSSLEQPAPRHESASAVAQVPTVEVPATPSASPPVNSAPRQATLPPDAQIAWQANQVMRALGHIAETLQDSEYTHGFRVDSKQGVYHFDCSGLVHYILGKVSPVARSASFQGVRGRPLARDYYRTISRSPVDAPRAGWQKIERVADVEPGDLIAWIKPKVLTKSTNTGHVAFVVLPPVTVPDSPGAYLLRVADASSLHHDDDTRVGRDGFGMGTILLLTDEQGRPVEYGWVGLKWRTFETRIAIGRISRPGDEDDG